MPCHHAGLGTICMYSSAAAPEVNQERGFLPVQDPLLRLPKPFDAWEEVALRLPKYLASDHIRQNIESLPPFPTDMIGNEQEQERAMVLLSYLGHAYVWTGARPAEILPKRIALPWYEVA